MNKKNVLFVVNTMGRAGAERVLCSLLKVFDTDKYNVDVFSLVNRGELFEDLPDTVNILNKNPVLESIMDKAAQIDIGKKIIKYSLKGGYGLRNLSYLRESYKSQKKMGRVQFDKLFWMTLADGCPRFEKEYDLAVAFLEGGATYYVTKHVRAKAKASFVHVDYSQTGYVKHLDKPYFDAMQKIFCVSNTVREGFVAEFPEYKEKTFVMHNAVLCDEVRRRADEGTGFDDGFDGIRLLTVARLHPQKAYDVAIPAMAMLVEQGYDNIKWYVMGEGAERPKLEKMIEDYNLQDKFILMGTRSNPYPYMKECDYYIHATRFEGWCIAVAEALILGNVLIVSDCAGMAEQIKNGETGIIIELTAENIADAIKKIIADDELRNKIKENVKSYRVEFEEDIKMLYGMTD